MGPQTRTIHTLVHWQPTDRIWPPLSGYTVTGCMSMSLAGTKKSAATAIKFRALVTVAGGPSLPAVGCGKFPTLRTWTCRRQQSATTGNHQKPERNFLFLLIPTIALSRYLRNRGNISTQLLGIESAAEIANLTSPVQAHRWDRNSFDRSDMDVITHLLPTSLSVMVGTTAHREGGYIWIIHISKRSWSPN
jgi:hypothetical protein